MKIGKIRELDATEIAKQRLEADEQIFRLRLQVGMGQVDGLKKYRALRKARARMLTVLRERELGASPAAPAVAAEAAPVKAAVKKPAAKKTAAPKKAAPKKAAAARPAAKKKAAAKPKGSK
jgi:large subunit ribosomal protein L29